MMKILRDLIVSSDIVKEFITEYVGIVKKNNWGSTYYEAVGIDQKIEFVDGDKINAEFPDGTVRAITIKNESTRKSMMDMGHTYNYVDTVSYATFELCGLVVKVDVDKLKFEMVVK